MGLTDELYIKMNSRGKPLTLFEHFKAELEREIRNIDDELANKIVRKIDIDWTDLLWKYRNSNTGSLDDNIIDDEFLRYFKFIIERRSPQVIEEKMYLNFWIYTLHQKVRMQKRILKR